MEQLKVYPIDHSGFIDTQTILMEDHYNEEVRFMSMMSQYPIDEKINPEEITKFLSECKKVIDNGYIKSIMMTPQIIEFTPVCRNTGKFITAEGKRATFAFMSAIMEDEDSEYQKKIKNMRDEVICKHEDIDQRVGLLFYFKSDKSLAYLQSVYGNDRFGKEGDLPVKWIDNSVYELMRDRISQEEMDFVNKTLEKDFNRCRAIEVLLKIASTCIEDKGIVRVRWWKKVCNKFTEEELQLIC